jgi:hypothetical protein
MTTARAIVAAFLAAVIVTLPGAAYTAPVRVPAPTPAPRIEEDSPAWNCHALGNLQCGPGSFLKTPYATTEGK